MGDDILNDSRFTKYLKDPIYRQIPKHERKVKIDKRFNDMFKDKKFKVKYTVDKRGRPINESSTENLRKYYDLDDDEDSGSSEEEEDEKEIFKKEKKGSESEDEEEKIDSVKPGLFVKRPPSDSENENAGSLSPLHNDQLARGELKHNIKEKLLDLEVDYARGEGLLQTDSSSDDDSSVTEEDSELEHEWGALDANAETTEDATKRFAVCNMDWDNIKAGDIMVLLNSFLPPGGVIYRVTVYPSEYGQKRMQEEEVRGPIELTKNKEDDKANDSDDVNNEEGSAYHMEKLRRYQLNRLKYYYAVVECDSVSTADKLYTECDGMEYESSSTKLDMRFIPDDVTFDEEPRETCTNLPDLTKYKPRLFTTTALQQAKVELTWDATNPNRSEVIKNALDGKIDDLDLKEYLASSSEDDNEEPEAAPKLNSDSDNEEPDPIDKYKSLLLGIQDKEEKKKNKDMEMEITWGLGVKEKAEELVKKKTQQVDKDLTPFEKILEKRKEKKKQKKVDRIQRLENVKTDSSKLDSGDGSSDEVPSDVDMNDPYFAEEFNKTEFKKNKGKSSKLQKNTVEDENDVEAKRIAELELLLDEDDGKAHFSLKKIQAAESVTKKSKRKKKLKEKMKDEKQALPDFAINVADDRFSAIYNSHLYNIDPTDPNYKKTKNMEILIQEKLKRRPAETPIFNETVIKKSKEEAEVSLLVKNIIRKTKGALKMKM